MSARAENNARYVLHSLIYIDLLSLQRIVRRGSTALDIWKLRAWRRTAGMNLLVCGAIVSRSAIQAALRNPKVQNAAPSIYAIHHSLNAVS